MPSVLTADGARVAVHRLGIGGPPGSQGPGPPEGQGGERALVLVHATGFCAASLGPLAAGLAGRFGCVAIDSRAHGASEPAPGESFEWDGFAL
ncbi:MAG: hypothetical protein ACRDYD_10425, partial [Acidimicrobiales bacterium]